MTVNEELEWKTRKQRIDPRLDKLGWKRVRAIAYRTEENPTEHYDLWTYRATLLAHLR